MVAAVLDALFLPVLVGVLVGYRAGRDPVQRDVLLVFVAMTVFFVRNLIRQLGGTLPALVDDLATTLLLAQPGLTLRLAGRLRPLPRWLWPSALAAYLAAVAVTFAVGTPPPLPAVLVRVGCLTATGVAAAVVLAGEARRRSGSPRARLRIAAVATATFAAAITISALPVVVPDVRAVALRLPHAGRGALLLVNRYRVLFIHDDVRLVAELAGQCGIEAERAGMLAERE